MYIENLNNFIRATKNFFSAICFFFVFFIQLATNRNMYSKYHFQFCFVVGPEIVFAEQTKLCYQHTIAVSLFIHA